MKKLLLIAAVASAGMASADNVRDIYENEYLTAISPNGEWAAGDIDMGSVVIRNLVTGDVKTFVSTGDEINYHIGGGATPISDSGIVVGSVTGENAAYYENGVWTELKVPYPEYSNAAKSITPDGSVICGLAGMEPISIDSEGIMAVPAIWRRQADGSYSEAEILPHPKLDFTGMVPQYVTALAISADGKTIAGQVRDYIGFMEEPIVYTCDDNGTWSYKMLYPELIKPASVNLISNPGEYQGRMMPSPEEFMTEEELDTFRAALDAGIDAQYEDYMTEEEFALYLKAYEEWFAEYDVWDREYSRFVESYSQCLDQGYAFLFNNVALTPDGKYYATTREVTVVTDPTAGPEGITVMRYPVVLNTDGSGYKDLDGNLDKEGLSLLMTSMTVDGSVLATYFMYPADGAVQAAYIFPEQATEAIPFVDFIAARNEDLAVWMESEMYQDVLTLTPSGDLTTTGFLCSGAPVATPDMSTVICYTTTEYWEGGPNAYLISYVFDTGFEVSSVKGIEAVADGALRILPGSRIAVEGEVANISVFDLSGANVLNISNPSGIVATGLPSGVYIVHSTGADGSVSSAKAIF